jgi:hypothetical protein
MPLVTLRDPDHLPALDTAFVHRRPASGLATAEPKPKFLLLYGSLRERSFSRFAVEEAARLLQFFGAETRIFNPRDLPLPDYVAGDDHPAVHELPGRVPAEHAAERRGGSMQYPKLDRRRFLVSGAATTLAVAARRDQRPQASEPAATVAAALVQILGADRRSYGERIRMPNRDGFVTDPRPDVPAKGDHMP